MTDVTPPRGPSGPSDERPEAGDELTPEELACGYLDGELAPDERAQVEANPTLMALVAELRTVSEAVASPVAPLTEDRRAAMLAAAVAALPAAGAAGTGSPAAAGTDTVTSLEAARHRRSTRLVRTVAGGLAAAAAVGLVALVVTRGPGSNDVDTADGAAETATLEAGAGGESADTTTGVAEADAAPADTSTQVAAAGSEAPATEAPAAATDDAATSAAAPRASTGAAAGGALPDLGPLANRREARSATEAFTFVDALASPGDGPCAGYAPPVATATFQGAPAYVVIIETAPDGNRLAFLDQATCVVLVKVDPANA